MATGDPALSQDQGPAILEWQDRPTKMPQFMGTATAAPAAPGAGDDGAPGGGNAGLPRASEPQQRPANPWAQLDGYGRIARRLGRNTHGLATPQMAQTRLAQMWGSEFPNQQMPAAPAPLPAPTPGLPSARPQNPYTVNPRKPGFGQNPGGY